MRENTRYIKVLLRGLMFLARKARPDLSVAASILSSNLHNCSMINMANARRALRYLCGASKMEMSLRQGNSTQLLAYVDDSWNKGVETTDRNGIGSMILYGEVLISATRRLQKCVSFNLT